MADSKWAVCWSCGAYMNEIPYDSCTNKPEHSDAIREDNKAKFGAIQTQLDAKMDKSEPVVRAVNGMTGNVGVSGGSGVVVSASGGNIQISGTPPTTTVPIADIVDGSLLVRDPDGTVRTYRGDKDTGQVIGVAAGPGVKVAGEPERDPTDFVPELAVVLSKILGVLEAQGKYLEAIAKALTDEDSR